MWRYGAPYRWYCSSVLNKKIKGLSILAVLLFLEAKYHADYSADGDVEDRVLFVFVDSVVDDEEEDNFFDVEEV